MAAVTARPDIAAARRLVVKIGSTLLVEGKPGEREAGGANNTGRAAEEHEVRGG